MKTNKSTTEFWTVLTLVNGLALIYPINLLLSANSVDENLFGRAVYSSVLFFCLWWLMPSASWSLAHPALKP